MRAARIVQVSDLHLGSAAGIERQLQANAAWGQFLDWVRLNPPDLVLVTGDIVVDDPDSVEDHRYAQRRLVELEELGVPMMVLPGNHDVGDHPVRDGLPPDWHGAVVTDDRIRRWESLWGRSWQLRDVAGWTLIGLNSQLFASGLRQEREQWNWLLSQALPHAARRRCIVFLHESLHLRPEYRGAAPANGWMSIPAESSERLAAALTLAGVDLVCSGHTHRFARWSLGGLSAVNAPGLVGPIPERVGMVQPHGDTAPGWVEFALGSSSVQIRHILRSRCTGMSVSSVT